MRRTLFRYAGGKGKIVKYLMGRMMEIGEGCVEYREPFFGGGSVGLEVMANNLFNNVWINDKDYGISCLWNSVINCTEELKDMIRG